MGIEWYKMGSSGIRCLSLVDQLLNEAGFVNIVAVAAAVLCKEIDACGDIDCHDVLRGVPGMSSKTGAQCNPREGESSQPGGGRAQPAAPWTDTQKYFPC